MKSFAAMNTEFLVAGLPEAAASWVEGRVREAEERLSRFLPGSEVSRLNHRAGEWTVLSPLLAALLDDAVRFQGETEGIFSPFLGKGLAALGYDRSFEGLVQAGGSIQTRGWVQARGGVPGKGTTPSGVERPGKLGDSTRGASPGFRLDSGTRSLRLDEGASLDLGGFAKGWTAQRAADHLQGMGYPGGLIDAGGDISLWGTMEDGGPWCVGVAHPFREDEDLALLWSERPMAMATSSVLKRRWHQGGMVFHHILDPRTGAPAQSDLVQATVLAPDLATAEVYAKVLLILGSQEGPRRLAQKRPELAYLAMDARGRPLISDNLRCYCTDCEVTES